MDDSRVEVIQSYADVERAADDAIPMALFIVEAVTNAMKYAFGPAGGQIHISLGVDVDGTTLVISDNGRGFDPATTSETQNGGGLGSKLMTAFSRQLSAELTVESSLGGGCRLTLFMPRDA